MRREGHKSHIYQFIRWNIARFEHYLIGREAYYAKETIKDCVNSDIPKSKKLVIARDPS